MKKGIATVLTLIMVFLTAGCNLGYSSQNTQETTSEEVISEPTNQLVETSSYNVFTGSETNYGVTNYSGSLYQQALSNLPYRLTSEGCTATKYELISNTGTTIYSDDTGNTFVLAGTERVKVTFMSLVNNIERNKLRDNTTGYRIGVYESQAEATVVFESLDRATRLISGEELPTLPIPELIINGQAYSEAKVLFDIQANSFMLPITFIAESRGYSWYEEAYGIVIESWCGPITFLSVEPDSSSSYKTSSTKSGEWFAYGAEFWGDSFPLIKKVEGEWYGDAEMISRLLGMDIMIAAGYVHVVSDPYDVPQRFFVYDVANGTYTEIYR